jgi:fatty acid desaturase
LADWCVIASAIGCAVLIDQWWAYGLALPVIGNRQHALAVLGHDAAHGHASRRRLMNDALAGVLTFWPLGIGLAGYRRFHFAHHRWLNVPGLDPELELRHGPWDSPRASIEPSDYLPGCVLNVLRLAAACRPREAADVLGPVAVYAIALTVLPWPATALWVAALLTTFWLFFRLRVLTEHVGVAGTRRLRRPSFWCRVLYLPHGTWKHAEHHEDPATPTWALAVGRGQGMGGTAP